jgi:hypothetical protein
MTYQTQIETKRHEVKKCEQHVDAQRRRLTKLSGREADKWVAKQLLAASKDTLRANREHLDCMLNGSTRT